jgi:hypothetical protein
VPDDKLQALMAELRAIELWNRSREEGSLGNEIYKVGFQARQMRQLEIMREINILLRNTDQPSKECR